MTEERGSASDQGPLRERDFVVVGGGIAGLATAYFLSRRFPDKTVSLFEKEPRFGGNIRSVFRGDLAMDLGPDALVSQPPAGLDLCRELGLESILQAPSDEASGACLALDGHAEPLPDGLSFGLPRSMAAVAATPLLSFAAKCRAAMDVVLPAGPATISLGEHVERRLGPRAREQLFEPMTHALYDTPSHDLDRRSVLPWLREGSIVRQLASRPRGSTQELFRRPPQGMDQLVATIRSVLAEGVTNSDASVQSVRRKGDVWEVAVDGVGVLRARNLFLAVPPHRIREMLDDSDLHQILEKMRSRSVVSVALAVEAQGTELPRGIGLLAHPGEKVSFLAATFFDRKWGMRPDREVLLRVVLRPVEGLDDAANAKRAHEELRRYIPLGAIRWSAAHAYDRAMTVPIVGLPDLVRAARKRAQEIGALHLVGAAFDGPGVSGAVGGVKRAVAALSTGSEAS